MIISWSGWRPASYGALRAGRFADKAVLFVGTVLAAIPSFVAVDHPDLGLRGAAGLVPDLRWRRAGSLDQLYHLFLPSIALSLTFIALVARVTRSSMLDELKREHVEVALSRGPDEGRRSYAGTCCATRSARS